MAGNKNRQIGDKNRRKKSVLHVGNRKKYSELVNNRCSFNNWSRTASKSNNTQSESVKYLIQSFVISATLRPSHRRSIIETGDGARRHRTASSSYQATAACHHDSSANTTKGVQILGFGVVGLEPLNISRRGQSMS